MPRKVQKSKPAPKKRSAIPLPVDPVSLLEKFKDYPAIDVISRRFNDPNEPGSLPILLRGEDDHACHNSDHQNKLRSGAARCGARMPDGGVCQQPARIWHVRWFNLGQEGRRAQMRQKGYIPVDMKDLKDTDDISDLFKSKEDTAVRRGDHGQEMLGKVPLELYNEVRRRQAQIREDRAQSRTAMRDDLAEAAGRDLGDEAGQSIADGDIRVESMTRSRTTLAEEAGAEE